MKQTVAHLLKRTFATILAFTVVSGSMLASMPTSYAADLPSATVTYDFHKLGVEGQETQAGWSIDSQTDTSILYKAPYGLQVDNYSADRIISFNFDVPAGSPYELQLSSALAAGGCIANVLIDDNVVGEYNFYYDSYVADTGLKSLKTIMLTGGTHKLSLVAASQPDGSWGYCMYPGQFVLVPKATVPTLDQLTLVPGKNPLTVGDTTVLAVSGKYSDGNIHKILNPSLQLTASGDDKVITIDSDSKEITAVGEGIATIQASVVEDGKTVEGSVQLTVMKETLTEIDLISDKMGLSSGDTAQLSVTGKLNTKADADLSNATMEFATSNSNVATVDKSTKILTAVGNGTATITAKVTLDGVTFEKSILISVYNGTLQSVSASAVDTTLDFAQYSQINVKGTFSGDTIPVALNKDSLTFTSSNEDTIKANADGKVWAVGTGSASVTVKSNISGIEKTATVDFTVNQVTTILYDFHKLGVGTQETQPSWDIVTAETNPTLSAQPYGLHVENDSNGNEISFSFVVPLESPYQLQFSSAQASGGGVSSMMIDGKEIKQWDFYSAVYVADTGLKPLKTMILTKGTHTFTMKSVSQTNGSWGYRMYPGSFVLVKKDSIPVLKDISLSASIAELSKGQTSQLQVTGTLNDGTTDSLGDATIGYTSSNETIATVDATGAVKATGVGTATLTATVTLDAVVISKTIQIVVNNAVLKSVTMTTDKTELVVGQTAQITLQGILTNSKSINLSDASVSYTSSDEAVATVDSNGIVTSVGEGSAIINASVTLGDITLANTVTIHVEKRILKQVELTAIDSATEVALGETKQLKVLATMNDGTAVDLTKNGVTVAYLSANTDIATVGQSTGLVTASTSNEGTANIQVNVTLDGITKSSTIAIKVFSWDTVKNEKQKSSLYTAAKVATARENVVKYSWAKAEKDNAVATADQFVALGNDYLWNLVTPQSLPRSYTVNDAKGSPTSGTDIYTKTGSNYPWIIDPVNHPFKIQDPISKEYFPTNDFASYYKSGLNGNGIFDPKLADKQYLINTSGNGKGDSWGVDDGYGFVNTDGTKYTFIAYYNHWLWYNGGATNYGFIQRALDSLRDAYLYTGEAKYAQSGTILLDRIADVYPSMDSSVYKWADGFQNSHGGTGLGKVVGSIWETILVPSFIRAYDAFYPGMDDPSIISFLSEKAAKYDISNPKSTSAAIKKNIEDGIIKQVVPGVKNCQLEGNTGMQQSCVALAAVVIDTLPETKDWLDFDFKESELTTNPRTVSGGDLWPILVNEVDRDGQGAEAAPGYNNLWLDQLKQVADVIDGYSLEGLDFSVDLYKNPKFMKMFKAFYPLILSGRYTAQIGDTGAVADPSIIANVDDCIQGFAKTGDPILAQLTYSLNHNSTNGIHADIFTKDPEKVAVDIKNVITAQGEFKLNSSNMTGFGFAALRDGINYIKTSGITYQFANMNIIEQTAQLKYFSNSGTEQFDALSDGNHITISFDVAKSNDYELDLRTFKSSSYGIYDIYIDDKLIHTYDFYGGSGAGQQFDPIGNMTLTAGTHTIKFVGHGKNANSDSYKMGLIELAIYDKEAQAIRDNSNLKGDTQRDVWIYYGRNSGHGHADTLNLGMHAFGLDLAPDLGYPEVTGEDPKRMEWISNTISHNTVVVDKAKQSEQVVGQPLHFDDSTSVKLIDINAPGVYKQTEMYRRTTAMIKVDDENSYTLDLFRVKGGNDHYYSFHSTDGTVSTEGLSLTAQPTGTYAGPNIDFGVRTDSVAGWGYTGSGFHYLKNVEKQSNPQKNFSIDWKINDFRNILPAAEDVHLKMTMLNEVSDVALADGVPPQRSNNPETLQYVIAHRAGTNLNSLFTAIYQPYKVSPFIDSMTTVPVTLNGTEVTDGSAVAVKVVLKNGRTDYIVNSLDKTKTYVADSKINFKGFFGVYSEKNGLQVSGYLNDGTVINKIHMDAASLVGTVSDFTKELSSSNIITVKLPSKNIDLGSLAGRYIYVENDGIRNASYQIKSASKIDATHVALDLGDTTLIRSYKDVKDFTKGYIYDVAVGSKFSIPLSSEQIISLSKVTLSSNKKELTRTKTAVLTICGELTMGKKADLSKAKTEYFSSDPSVAKVENGVVTAYNAGSANIYTKVTLDGVTVQSNTITIKVSVSTDSLKQLINMYQKTGDINKSVAADLKDSLDKVNKEMKKHPNEKAVKQMNKFIELLTKAAKQSKISATAKDILTIDANAFIRILNS